MENNTNPPQSGSSRRTFIKRAAGTVLLFGVGTTAFAANTCSGVGLCLVDPIAVDAGTTTASACIKAGGTVPCTLYTDQACADSKAGGAGKSHQIAGGSYCG